MNTKSRIAVCSRSFSKHTVLRSEILEGYTHVTFNETGAILSGNALIEFLRGHDKAIVGLECIDSGILGELPELEVVSKYGVGLDSIDIVALRMHGKRLGWTAGINRRSVSELVIAFAISLLRQVLQANASLKAGEWRQPVGTLLSGKTIGIVGCGNIGKDLVSLLKPFDCRILVNDIRNYEDFYIENKILPITLEELLTSADIVTLHVPLDTSTFRILDSQRLSLMKMGSVLINTARGGLVDESYLAKMLKDGRIAAAGFDVFEIEPQVNIDLVQLPNFFATPHIGGSASEAILAMGRAAIDGLENNKIP